MKEENTFINDLIDKGYSIIPITESLFNKSILLNKDFFAQDLEIKYKTLADENSGILGYCPSKFELEKKSIINYKGNDRRVFSSFYFVGDNFITINSSSLLKSNKWPSENFKILGNELYVKVSQLSKELLELIVQYIISPEIVKPSLEKCFSLMRLIDYPPVVSEYNSKEHKDPELFSLIITDQIGLEIRNKSNQWEKLEVKCRSAIILVGESLEYISKKQFKAIAHRVSIKDKGKQTIVFFQGLPLDYVFQKNDTLTTFKEHIYPILLTGAPHLKYESIE